MRPSKMVAACAVSALAMVFSVQEGEYGPLVVYKLQVPKESAASAAPSRSTSPAPAGGAAGYVIPSRAPRVLGTVVMPAAAPLGQASQPASLDFGQASAGELPLPASDEVAEAVGGVVLSVPDRAAVLRIVENAPVGETMFNADTGDVLTLQQVHNEVSWRRDTAEKLRHGPFAPRF